MNVSIYLSIYSYSYSYRTATLVAEPQRAFYTHVIVRIESFQDGLGRFDRVVKSALCAEVTPHGL